MRAKSKEAAPRKFASKNLLGKFSSEGSSNADVRVALKAHAMERIARGASNALGKVKLKKSGR